MQGHAWTSEFHPVRSVYLGRFGAALDADLCWLSLHYSILLQVQVFLEHEQDLATNISVSFLCGSMLWPHDHIPHQAFFFFLKSHPPSSCVQTLEGRRQPSCPCAIPAIWHVIKACYQVPPRFMRARHIAAASTCFQFTSLDEEDLWLHPPPHRTFFRTAVWLERINFEVVALSPQCVLQAPFLAHVLWKMLPKPTGIFIATSSVFLPRQTQDGESSPRKSMTPCSSEQFGYRYSQGQEFSSGDPTLYL